LPDDKIIAVAAKDPAVNYISDISELPKHFIAVLRNYFEQYKALENKKVEIDDFQEKTAAYAVISAAIDLYKTTFPK
jgi:inorganic pyrophosphatase